MEYIDQDQEEKPPHATDYEPMATELLHPDVLVLPSPAREGHHRAPSVASTVSVLGEEDFEFKSEEVFNPSFGVVEEVLAADEEVTAVAAQDGLLIVGTSVGRIVVLEIVATRFHEHWTQERELISQIAVTGNGFAALGRFGTATFIPFPNLPMGKGFKAFRIDFGLNPEEGHATAVEIVHERIDKQDLVAFVGTAGGKVVRYSQGFFSAEKVEWYAGPSPVLEISVLHGLLTFSLHNEVFFRDLLTRQKIASIYFAAVPESVKSLPFARIDRLRAPSTFWRF